MKNPDQLSQQLPPGEVMGGAWPQDLVSDGVQVYRRRLKRKSREPQRLCRDVDTDGLRPATADRSDLDSADDSAPMHVVTESRCAALPPGLSEGGGALDMRIAPRLSQALPHSFSEIPHWTPPISHRLRMGLRSAPHLETPTSGPPATPQVTPLTPPRPEHLEPLMLSSQESPRKRAGLNADGHLPARVPEVKAIQQTRRLLANARERTRVHTISAAFEALRKQVPCYSYGQKLSKLAILRIACNYILSLAQLAELDYSPDRSSLTFAQCVDQCTRTLQAEGRSKKRKE